MTSAAAPAPEDLRAQVERLERELADMQKDLDDETEEADRLLDEVKRLEVASEGAEVINSRQRYALAHARTVLDALKSESAFEETMNVRAVDAITELLGDR